LAIREAILREEERIKNLSEDDDDDEEEKDTTADEFLITKKHFNFAMSRARRSVGEKDLALFEEFAEKQKAGRGKAATNFKFEDVNSGAAEDGDDGADDGALPDDLYE